MWSKEKITVTGVATVLGAGAAIYAAFRDPPTISVPPAQITVVMKEELQAPVNPKPEVEPVKPSSGEPSKSTSSTDFNSMSKPKNDCAVSDPSIECLFSK